MNCIKPLDWDTHFFGYKIGKLRLSENEIFNFDSPEANDFQLVYIFASQVLESKHLQQINAELQDIKIELIKDININSTYASESSETEIIPITEFSDDLYQLVLESGIFSRFKLDKHFVNNEFERLYKAWIVKSLMDSNTMVMGAFNNKELVGFISFSLNVEGAAIGLIAVHENARGKHIGKLLLETAFASAARNKIKTISVITQEMNKQAMHFYLQNGFRIDKKSYIYHRWKKT